MAIRILLFAQLLIAVLFLPVMIAAQPDSIKQRVIFIGDAGEIDDQQSGVITTAASKILGGKTTVVYLGDNVYPVGMGLPGSPEEAHTQDILRAQYQPMRNGGAPVYFLPGNHDWDRMGKDGLKKIKAQWNFLESQHDSLLKLLPKDGCPDPTEVSLSDHLVLIIFDSEWWLFPHDKRNPDADCDCSTKEEVVLKMEDIFYRNRFKTILLADHHPFQSYGHHGGHYGWQDHIFPLTAINKNLYIPLPVVGSLYPFLRRTFSNPEDAVHPVYKDMIRNVDSVFDTFPNLVHVSGHEHGMQFIKNKNKVQVVSGAGSKQAFVKKGKHSLFAERSPGFVLADEMTDNSVRFTYYTKEDGDSALQIAFTYTQPFVSVRKLEDVAIKETPEDSITVAAHPEYDNVSGFHRMLLGTNYRKEWAAPTTLPVIKISEIEGGLTPSSRGGGHQSHSLRLKDKDGKEWVLRSVNKFPEVLLPADVRQTFAADVLNDAMSAQHPYSALVVPPISNAVQVPHTDPIIGWVAPDKKLGMYNGTFAGTVNLLERRDPLGESVSTEKLMKKLDDDNDNNADSSTYLRARLLDVLINDWDRHEDQWHFVPQKNSYGGNTYLPVPRDRDQVFYINEGMMPRIASTPPLLFFMQDVRKVRNINQLVWESRFLDSRLLNQFSYSQWMNITNGFVSNVTDSVLETALRRLPESSYQLKHDFFFKTLQNRRAALPGEMKTLYHFINRIVDIQASDKNELVEISDTADGGLLVDIHKISKKGVTEQQLFRKVFDPSITKEIRLYTFKGNDHVVLHSNNKKIKLRIIGQSGNKTYDVEQAPRKTIVYGRRDSVAFAGGDKGSVRKHLSNDSANTAFYPTDLYNRYFPIINIGYNYDDGFILGAGIKYVHKGFRKHIDSGGKDVSTGSIHQISFAHSFSTNAYRVNYGSEWVDAIGKANILLNANVFAPDNTQNFFGLGNDTKFSRFDGYRRYFRARFNFFTANALLKWGEQTSISAGPAMQFYHFNPNENKGRFILNTTQLGYDSATLDKNKIHAGLLVRFINNKRDYPLFPTKGSYIDITTQSYAGLNDYSKSYSQITSSAAIYHSINYRHTVVLADRIGGGATFGKTTFYQSLFLDGTRTIEGYRQFRFAGKYLLYNNLEIRIKLTDLASYILPGQLGFIGSFDVGRVWEKDEHSDKWHNGFGAGLYFAPAQLLVVRFTMAHSTEGWFPDLSVGFRF